MNKTPIHFIGMAGMTGCLPNHCAGYATKSDAAAMLEDMGR